MLSRNIGRGNTWKHHASFHQSARRRVRERIFQLGSKGGWYTSAANIGGVAVVKYAARLEVWVRRHRLSRSVFAGKAQAPFNLHATRRRAPLRACQGKPPGPSKFLPVPWRGQTMR